MNTKTPEHIRTRKNTIAAVVVLAVAMVSLWFLYSPSSDKPLAASHERQTPPLEEGTTLSISTDPELVFQKAFWRRPGPEDKVLHAERLEWMNAAGEVVMWQWFLVVEPSAATRDWFADNPFALPPGQNEGRDLKEAYRPEWFPAQFTEHTLFESGNRRHKLALSKDGKRLYGTDSGFGFTQSNLLGSDM
ncbi:MAG: hypothetical protein JJU20_10790 [Opitutales bacterium]|nr:hypothetical protein [Opitutales bacterium]